jgi:hypothetical protein
MQSYPEHLKVLTPLQKTFLIEQIRTFMQEYSRWVGQGFDVFRMPPTIVPTSGRTNNGLILRYWGDWPHQLHTPWGIWPFGANTHPSWKDRGGLLDRVIVNYEWLRPDGRDAQCALLSIMDAPLPRPTFVPDIDNWNADLGVVTDEFSRLIGYDQNNHRWVR